MLSVELGEWRAVRHQRCRCRSLQLAAGERDAGGEIAGAAAWADHLGRRRRVVGGDNGARRHAANRSPKQPAVWWPRGRL